ncbi:MAG: (2Fe-2S)-binding protein [Gammaproteobacteria bacterium]|nr:(2Fe-2S)-binding protein [Gammaproteobacteria bacterium]
MYVCFCAGVNEAEIQRAISQGTVDVNSLADELGVGTGCGSCREFVQDIVNERQPEPQFYNAAG